MLGILWIICKCWSVEAASDTNQEVEIQAVNLIFL
jgi:hypothetical protein